MQAETAAQLHGFRPLSHDRPSNPRRETRRVDPAMTAAAATIGSASGVGGPALARIDVIALSTRDNSRMKSLASNVTWMVPVAIKAVCRVCAGGAISTSPRSMEVW